MKSLLLVVLTILCFGCANDKVEDKKNVNIPSLGLLSDAGGVYEIDTVETVFFAGGDHWNASHWKCLAYKNDKQIKTIDLYGDLVSIFYDSLSTKKIWVKHYTERSNLRYYDNIHVRTIEDLKYQK